MPKKKIDSKNTFDFKNKIKFHEENFQKAKKENTEAAVQRARFSKSRFQEQISKQKTNIPKEKKNETIQTKTYKDFQIEHLPNSKFQIEDIQ